LTIRDLQFNSKNIATENDNGTYRDVSTTKKRRESTAAEVNYRTVHLEFLQIGDKVSRNSQVIEAIFEERDE
jgi:hypothetical protein